MAERSDLDLFQTQEIQIPRWFGVSFFPAVGSIPTRLARTRVCGGRLSEAGNSLILTEHHSCLAPELEGVVGNAAMVNLDLEDLVKAGNARLFISLRIIK